jgi:hypothetical protein
MLLLNSSFMVAFFNYYSDTAMIFFINSKCKDPNLAIVDPWVLFTSPTLISIKM